MRELSRRDFLKLGRSPGDAGEPLVHIASLVVQATAAGCQAVRSSIGSMPGAELHETGQIGKVVVVLESADSRAIADATTELQQLPGVLTVSIVAHLMESASAKRTTRSSAATVTRTNSWIGRVRASEPCMCTRRRWLAMGTPVSIVTKASRITCRTWKVSRCCTARR